MSYAEKKEHDRLVKKAERKVKDAEENIAAIEDEIKKIEEELATGNNGNPDIYESHSALQKKLENAMSIWEMATMELEEISQ